MEAEKEEELIEEEVAVRKQEALVEEEDKMKLLVMGFDGMDYFKTQETGYFKELLENEQWGMLESIPSNMKLKMIKLDKKGIKTEEGDNIPHTGPCWSSIYTGVTPKEHGVTHGGWTRQQMNWTDIQTSMIFNKIQQCYSLSLMTMPVTYPALPIGEWMVSGFPGLTNKESFYNIRKEELPEDFAVDWAVSKDRHEPKKEHIYTGKDGLKRYKLKEGVANSLYNVEKRKIDALKNLPKTDVLFIGFTILDKGGHLGNKEEFDKCYAHAKQLYDQALEQLKPENWLICADHGFNIKQKRHRLEGFWAAHTQKNKWEWGQDTHKKITDIHDMILNILDIPTNTKRDKRIKQQLKELGYL